MSTPGPVFSYAQAAKGLAPSNQTTSTPSSTVTSAMAEKGGSISSDSHTSTHTKRPSTLENPSTQHKDASTESSLKTIAVPQDEQRTVAGDVPAAVQTTISGLTNGKKSNEADLAARGDDRAQTHTEFSKNTDQARLSADESHGDESQKSRETDDDWDKVSLPSVATESQLKAAPIPSVNIWQQRREAQEAKVRERHVVGSVPAMPRATNSPASALVDGESRKGTGKDGVSDKDPTVPQRRVNSAPRPVSDRKEKHSAQPSIRSQSQQSEKAGREFATPGTDAISWPTPESVLPDDRRKSSASDKNDKGDAKANSHKKWIQMPFVPTAKFETQLPPATNPRRGGRPGNRGRDTGGRGGLSAPNNASTEKADMGSMGPPPIPHKTTDHERGRKNNGTKPGRVSSVHSDVRRADSVDDVSLAAAANTAAQPKTVTDAAGVTQGAGHEMDEGSLAGDVSRASSRQPAASQAHAHMLGSEQTDNSRRSPSQVISPTDETESSTSRGGRFRNSVPDGVRANVDLPDRSVSGRERSIGRSEAARDKGEAWRERREPRTERSRGSHRGRGGHSGFNGHAHAYTAPIAQNGFEPQPMSPRGGRNRQASQPFVPSPSISTGRGNPRAQSIPTTVMGGFYGPMQAFPQAMSPMSIDTNFGQFPTPVQPGIMSAMPYNDSLNSYALLSMVITQLEYYFSIDNLCKDMFLRKNMDSQGFVALGVIAGFKRIKALTDGQMSHDQFRNACQSARNIEFVTADDGEDKMRSRDNWRDFVLPREERFEAAQNDGPSLRAQQQQQQPPAQLRDIPLELPGSNGPITSPQHSINGFAEPFSPQGPSMQYTPVSPFDGPGSEFAPRHDVTAYEQVRKSSTTSPLSKIQSPTPHEHARRSSAFMLNGHRRTSSYAPEIIEHAFPDEKIHELKVVVKDPSHENGDTKESTHEAGSAKVLGLRGGAGSLEHAGELRNIQFGQTVTSPPPFAGFDHPPYWSKDGKVTPMPIGPGYVHEDYLSLREKALNQRSDNHFDQAMAVVYNFWSIFLVDHYNQSMYQEFLSLATEDAENGSEIGKNSLIRFFESLLSSSLAVTEPIANDMVNLARQEAGERRPTFHMLRSAWRNGATNFKSRKRLGDLLTAEEKAEFDKSG